MRLENENYYDAELGCIVAVFRGFASLDQFREACELTITNMMRYSASRVLVNLVDMQVLNVDSQKYIQQEWFPKAIKAGLKRMAFVVPQNVFGKVSMENANKEAKSLPIDMVYFGSIEEASVWLKK